MSSTSSSNVGPVTSPSGAIPSGTIPSGTIPPGRIPSGTIPSGTMPPGTLPSSAPSPDVLTQRNDNSRTAAHVQPGLNPSVFAAGGGWGLKGRLIVDSAIFAQPLFVASQVMQDKKTHAVLYVATARNSIYAFDASTYALLWSVNLGAPDDTDNDPESFHQTRLPACATLSPLSIDDGVQPAFGMGIQSTPVIDTARGALFVSYRTRTSGTVAQHVAALSLSSGAPLLPDHAITTAELGQDINPLRQRASLLLSDGVLYLAFASHCEDFEAQPAWQYRGQLLAVDEATLAVVGRFEVTSSAKHGGGIWQGATGPAADDAGDVYFVTGNLSRSHPLASGDNDQNDPDYLTDATSYGGAAVRLHPVVGRAASGSIASFAFEGVDGQPGVADFFMPYRAYWHNYGDYDLGASGVLLVPGSNALMFAGKEGIAYVLDRADFGGYDPQHWTGANLTAACTNTTAPLCPYEADDPARDPKVLQKFRVGTNQQNSTPPMDNVSWAQWPHVHGTAAYADFANGRSFAYVWPEKDFLHAYERVAASGAMFSKQAGSSTVQAPAGGMPGGMVSIAVDPGATGVVFAAVPTDAASPVHGALRAYDPIPDATGQLHELWSDTTGPTYRQAKFVAPTIANGRVYLATSSNEVLVYGPGTDRLLSANASIAMAPQGAQLDALYVPDDGILRLDAVSGTSAPWFGPFSLAFAPRAAHIATGNQGQQEDAFFVDADGTVEVTWVTGNAPWATPVALTSAGAAPPGAPLATAVANASQLDLFYVGSDGSLMVQGVALSGGPWSAPARVSAPGLANPGSNVVTGTQNGGQLDVFVVDAKGTVELFFASGLGAWQGPVAITPAGFAPPGSAAATINQGTGQLDMFVVDGTGAVDVLWVAGTGAWNMAPLSGAGFAPAGAALSAARQTSTQLDLLVIDKTGTLDVFVNTGGPWSQPIAISSAGALTPGGSMATGIQGTQLDALAVTPAGALVAYFVSGANPWAGPFLLP